MSKNRIEIFTDETQYGVEEQANNWAEEEDVTIVSANLAVHGDGYTQFYLTVVYKENV